MELVYPKQTATEDFLDCWRSAGLHFNSMKSEYTLRYVDGPLCLPLLAHLTFILGNQLFFICIQGLLQTPSGKEECIYAAKRANGIPCLLKMQRTDKGWAPIFPGWGLVHAETLEIIDPPKMVNEDAIEISDWELMDCATQLVMRELDEEGKKIVSHDSNPDGAPSIYFEGEQKVKNFVQVIPARYPNLPDVDFKRLREIKEMVRGYTSGKGFYAEVSLVASEDEGLEGNLPLLRGRQYTAKFDGLKEI